jgi:iron complex outermembrane receptor protein
VAWKDEKSNAFTGRAGVVYLADNGLAPFISWSQSYQPQAGTDRVGNRFKPTTGEQYEIGLRYQPADQNILLSATVYQLTRQNVTTSDQVDDSYSVQTGEIRSRGFELEAKAQVSPLYSLVGAYTYIDAKTTRSNIASEVGPRTGAVPHHQFALWNDFDLSALGITGLKIGGAARYVGPSTGTYIDVRVPGSTLYDALISYARGPWQLTVNMSNLTDKTYVTNCIDVCYYGEPRRVIGTLAYRW